MTRAAAAGADPRAVNAEAGAAWRAFDAAERAVLTPHQLERIASVTEHAMAGHEAAGHGADAHDTAGTRP